MARVPCEVVTFETDLLRVRLLAVRAFVGLFAIVLSEVVIQVSALFEGLVAAINEACEDQDVLACGRVELPSGLVPVVRYAFVPFLWNLLVLVLCLVGVIALFCR